MENPSQFMGEPGVADPLYEWLLQFLPSKGSALDLGCGRGRWLGKLQSSGMTETGVDHDAESVDFCQQQGLRAVRAEVLDFLDGATTYDVVSALHLIEHLSPPDAQELFSRTAQSLGPQGRFIVVTPNFKDWRTASEVFWLDPTHVRPYPSMLMAQMAAEAGLRLTFTKAVGKIKLGKRAKLYQPLGRVRFGADFNRMNSVCIFQLA